MDVGSGGGLPGHSAEDSTSRYEANALGSNRQKTRFLEEVVEDLALGDTEIANARAELVGRDPAYREKYEVATARALAPLPTLSEYCLPLVSKGGCLVAMKALPNKEEIESGCRAAEMLGAEISELVEVEFLPELPPKQRCLVIMTKMSETPREYPRAYGDPEEESSG